MRPTPGSALIGYAILRANYDASLPSYLDNFTPFVLSVLANSNSMRATESDIANRIHDMFGLRMPELVVKRLMKRTRKKGLTEKVSEESSRLTEEGINRARDLQADVQQFERQQNELVCELKNYIESRFSKSKDLSDYDLRSSLARFFDRYAVPLVKSSLDSQRELQSLGVETEYMIASFVNFLFQEDQARFDYVVNAAKGAMLASVLEFGADSTRKDLGKLNILLDAPVLMDALGFHGEVSKVGIRDVLTMARDQGAMVAAFRHSVDELRGILERIESDLRSSHPSGTNLRGYRHFVEEGYTPADILLLRSKIEALLDENCISIVDRQSRYYELDLDEKCIEVDLQQAVNYRQRGPLINDVKSIIGTHMLKEGVFSTSIERARAVFISWNGQVVRVANARMSKEEFPAAIAPDALASILWVTQPAVADAVPRSLVLASAFAGMQPPPTLWRRYVEEIERLESSGKMSIDEAVVLRSTSVGWNAFMEETLGEEGPLASPDFPLVVLKSVEEKTKRPMQESIDQLSGDFAATKEELSRARESLISERRDKERLESEAKALKGAVQQFESRLTAFEERDRDRAKSIQGQVDKFVHALFCCLLLIIRILLAALLSYFIWQIVGEGRLVTDFRSWVEPVLAIVVFGVSLMKGIKSRIQRLEKWVCGSVTRIRLRNIGLGDSGVGGVA